MRAIWASSVTPTAVIRRKRHQGRRAPVWASRRISTTRTGKAPPSAKDLANFHQQAVELFVDTSTPRSSRRRTYTNLLHCKYADVLLPLLPASTLNTSCLLIRWDLRDESVQVWCLFTATLLYVNCRLHRLSPYRYARATKQQQKKLRTLPRLPHSRSKRPCP